jgi:molybdopterin-guanine dinucleotide biosynthesis protein A
MQPQPWPGCRIAGALVAGGIGRRFGADKALAVLAGERNLERGWRLLAPFEPRWLIAGSRERTAMLARALAGTPLAAALVADDSEGFGPLGGLATALRLAAAAERDAVALLAVDLPNLTPGYWDWLIAQAPDHPTPALVPRDPDGRWHPLAGLYRVELGGAAAEAIAHSRASLQRFLAAVDAHPVTLPAAWQHALHNVNTPADARGL